MSFENIFESFIETNIKQEPTMLVLYPSSCNVWKGPNSTGFKWNQEILLVTNTKCSDWKYKKAGDQKYKKLAVRNTTRCWSQKQINSNCKKLDISCGISSQCDYQSLQELDSTQRL